MGYRLRWGPITLRGITAAMGVLLLGFSLAGAEQPQKAQAPAEQSVSADPAKLLSDANRLFDAQNYEEALATYLKVYRQYRNSFDVNRRIGWLYINGPKRNTRAAIPYLRRAHELNAQDAGALHELAQATAWAGLYSESIPLYQQWLPEASKATAEPLLEFARTLSWAGRTADSIKSYQNYLDRAPTSAAARVELGRLLVQQKDYAGGLEQYNYVLRFSPGNVAAHIGKAQIMAYTGQVQESLAEVEEALKRSPRNFDGRVVKAYDLLWLGNLEEAEKTFAELAKQSPKNPDVAAGLKEARKQLRAQQQAKAAAAPPTKAAPSVALSTKLAPSAAPPVQPAGPDDLQLAEQSEDAQNYPDAIAHYRAFVKKNPDNFDAEYRLARVLGWNKEYAESESLFRQLVAKYPESTDNLLGLARVLNWQEKYAEALSYYEKAAKVHPDDAALRIEYARVLSYTKQYDPAVDQYRTALRLEPGNADAMSGLVQVLIWDDKLDAAKTHLAELEQAHPDNPGVATLRSQIATTEESQARSKAFAEGKAKEYFQGVVEKNPSDVTTRLQLADLYSNDHEFPKAIEQLRAAASLKPDDDNIRLQLARVLSWDRQYSDSEQIYQPWLASHPDNLIAKMEYARVLSWDKKYADSESAYREILKSQPDNLAARVELARVLSWSKDYDGAIKEYDQVLSRDPKNYDALVGKGRIYAYQSNWTESEAAYDAALAAKPDDRDAMTGKAQTLLWSDKPAKSRTLLTQLNSQNGDDPVVLVALASAENSLGRPDKALNLLKHAEQVAPNDPDVASVRKAIKAGERPELHLGWGYLRDNETLATWRYTLDFRFNLTPRLRNFVTINVLPTSARADFFGYQLFQSSSGGGYASRVPTDPAVPAPGVLGAGDFASFGLPLVPGYDRIRQNAEQFMAGGIMNVNRWFSWQAGAGFIELRHGSPDLSNAGLPSTRTRFIYSASPTFHIGRRVQLVLGSSRQYWAYTPKAISEEIYVDEQSATLVLNPTTRTRIALGGYHREVRPGFRVYYPVVPLQTFIYKIHGNGATVTATQAVVKRERGYIEIGYDGMAFGYTHPKGVGFPGAPAEYLLNTGVFTPSFYQRHAAMFHSSLKVTHFLTWDLHGTVGEQQVKQKSGFSFSSTAGSRLDINLSKKTVFSLGYDYFNAASAFQVVNPNRPAFAYHSSSASAGLNFTF
jgi:tetratricopeptide (TPR) repeat protein